MNLAENREIDSLKEEIGKAREKHDDIKNKVNETESALKSYDGYREFEKKLNDIEHRDEMISINRDLESRYRQKFVTSWMLKGTQDIITEADKILGELVM